MGIQFSEYKAGTTDFEECSGRGLCNHDTGTCKCFIGYGSGDGGGGKGGRNDCGYRVPYDPSSDNEPRWEKRLRGEFREWENRKSHEFRREQGRETELDRERDRGWALRDGLRFHPEGGFVE